MDTNEISTSMSSLGWFLLIAFASISVASLALKRTLELRGTPLIKALFVLGVAATGMSVIAWQIDRDWWVVGAFCGTAAVEAGPALLRAGVTRLRRWSRTSLRAPSTRSRLRAG